MAPVDIVYIFGAGSVLGAWEPVLRVLGNADSPQSDPRDANWRFSVTSSLNHLVASWGDLPAAQLRARFGADIDVAGTQVKLRALAEKNRRETLELKEAISKALSDALASGDIHVNEELLNSVAV